MPVLAANVVSTAQPLAAQAGLAVLARGGNAVDAAVATAIALTVVEPPNNGLGGDAFALVWDPRTRRLHGLNASGRAPAGWTYARFSRFAGMPGIGWDSVTVPGAVSAWAELSARFGRLPFAALFEQAIAYADRGYLVSPVIAKHWQLVSKAYRRFPEFAAAYLPAGRAPLAGELFRLPQLARSLESVAVSRGESFYRGSLAAKIVAASRQDGGALDERDLALHRADWVDPIAIEFEGVQVHELPPNGSGIAAQMALGMLAHTPALEFSPDSADSLHYQIEAMKLAFADVYRTVGDRETMHVSPHALLDPLYLARRASAIRAERAAGFEYLRTSAGDTVYLCAADSQGQMVSYIQSNYVSFGSGIVVPGTGISLHNRGLGFNTERGHPNCVGPRKRPFHTILPGFVMCDGAPQTAFGWMGGPMQPQGHLQLMLRMFGHGQNPQAAVDAPRWQLGPKRGVLVEEGVSEPVRAELVSRGHDVSVAPASSFGGAQVIHKIDGGYLAASESRKDGQAAGF